MSTYTLPDVCTLTETADYLRLKPAKVAQMLRDRKLGGIKEGRTWIIPRAAITAYLERNSPALAAAGHAPTEPVPPRHRGRTF